MNTIKKYLKVHNLKSEIKTPKLIFLIGFMGSGKTFVGMKLAELLDYKFIDLDEEVERKEASTISEIFSGKGEDYFRAQESFCLKSLPQTSRAIIATGGGTPCFFDNMKWMNENGITVFLDVPATTIFHQLKDEVSHRPLLAGKNDEELMQYIETTLTERFPFYRQSRICVAGNDTMDVFARIQLVIEGQV